MKSSHSILFSSALTVTLVTLAGCDKPAEKDMSKPTSPEIGKKADEAPPGADTDTPIAVDPKADETGAEEVAVDTRVEPPVDDASAKALVETGREVAQAIAAAVDALDAEQADAAKTSLDEAMEGLGEIEATRPNVEIVVATWRGNRALMVAGTEAAVDTVPLLAMLARVDAHDAEAIKTRHELRKGQKPEAVSKADKSADLEMVDANLVYQELDMPIATTEIHVVAARELVDQGKLGQAKDLLLRAVSSFGVVQTVVGSPEYKAHELLKDAQAAFARGDTTEAQQQLTAAVELLEPLLQDQGDAVGQMAVKMLLEDIGSLREPKTGDTKDAKTDSTSSLDAFRRVERHAMTLVRHAAMQEVMASRQQQELVALADALMWLEIAETEGLLDAARSSRAGGNLAQAQAVLASAREKATPATKSQFDDLHARVEKLAKLESAKSRKPEELESQYRRLAFDLRMMMLDLGMAGAEQEKASDTAQPKDKSKADKPKADKPKDQAQKQG